MAGRISGRGAAALTENFCIWDKSYNKILFFLDSSSWKIEQNKQKRFVECVKNAHKSLFLMETSCHFLKKW